jgi:CRP-like cAMP-binding protein
MHSQLVRKLEQQNTLSIEEKAVLGRAISRVMEYEADEIMAHEHDCPSECRLLLDGWASRYTILEDGRRQILAVHIAGDFVDLHGFPLMKIDHSIGALTDCKVAIVPHDVLREITERHPGLMRLLWVNTLIDAAITRKWLLNLGRKLAHERMAHLFCELYTRLGVVGLVADHSFPVPVTQAEFGDCLGISTVHTNRVLKDFRARGLIQWRGETVVIDDWERLRSLGQFDPTYLSLQS